MILRWRNLTGELLTWRGCQAWQSARATVLISATAGVTLDGRPMMRFKPYFCMAGTARILDVKGEGVFFVVYVPDVTSFRIGDFEIG